MNSTWPLTGESVRKPKNPSFVVDEQTILEALDAAFLQGWQHHQTYMHQNEESWKKASTPPSFDSEIVAAKLKLLQATGQMVDANARLVQHVADTLTDGKRF